MRRGFGVAALIALSWISGAPQVARAAITGQIAGTVTDQVSRAPLPGATVIARSAGGRYTAITDARGAFALIGVAPDTYTLSVTKAGYTASAEAGITVLADNTQNVALTLAPQALKTIGRSVNRSRPAASAFAPGQTEDSYTVSGATLKTIQGKAFNSDEKSLLSRLPSVTLDKSGTIFIRGGTAFETGYQFEGIDYTAPNANLQNPNQNVGNFNLLTSFGQVQLIPGGGDASHGNTGTGLVSITAKRGTHPAFGTADLETQFVPTGNQQYEFEYGIASADNRFSNYVAASSTRQQFQYGTRGLNGPSIGIYYPGANDPGTGVDVYNTAANQSAKDFIDNLFYKFGRDQNQQVQVFLQSQVVRQGLGYNGFATTPYLSGTNPLETGYAPQDLLYAQNSSLQNAPTADQVLQRVRSVIPLYPGQLAARSFLGTEDAIYNPFTAYKVEYSRSIGPTTYGTLRFYQTFQSQQLNEPGDGLDVPDNGGKRTGIATELSRQLGSRHYVQAGAKFEYVRPTGTIEQFSDLTSSTTVGNYFQVSNNGFAGSPAAYAGQPPYPAADFFASSACPQIVRAGSSTVVIPAGNVPNNGLGGSLAVPCGYIADRPGFAGVRLPYEQDRPLTNQQVYGLFAQDTVRVGSRLKIQTGLRLDGYNFSNPSDPSNPPTIPTVAHQRLLEPHFGLTEQIGTRDMLRATFGRTLSIPLPGLAGNYVSRAPYAAYAGIASYDNTKGAFDAANPAATAATYCGLSAAQRCNSYADQLYWLARDGKFGTGQLGSAVKGATFTNYDLTFAHEFPSGLAFNVTPFFRRGYDIVEHSNNVISLDYATGIETLGPALESNLGIQKSTGVELLLNRINEFGLSGQLSATYLNQLGNDPPGTYLSTNALLTGNLYRSPFFSPLQTTLALQYRWRSGLRINPIVSYNVGYPYGVGTLVQEVINGKLVTVPYTNVIAAPNLPASLGAGGTPSLYVDPQNPGTIYNPNIAATNGLAEGPSAGSLLSHPTFNVDLTIEYGLPGKHIVYGISFQNLFDQIMSVPVPNPRYDRYCNYNPIATGIAGPGVGSLPAAASLTCNTGFNAVSSPSGAPARFADYYNGRAPYLILPNRPPLTARLYMQVPF